VGSIFQQPPVAISPLSTVPGLGSVNPQAFQVGGFGPNPFAFAQTPTVGGINPYLNPQIGGEFAGQYGLGQFNPLSQTFPAVGQLAGQQAGQLGAGIPGQWGGSFTPGLNPLAQQAWGGVNPHILAQVLANPSIASDPIVGPLLAQQLNPLAVQQPPIRSLVGPQPFSPSQMGAVGQGIDPYSALVQAHLMSQFATNPYQQMFRAFTSSPWAVGAGLSSFTGQTPPFAQSGAPFGI
jgi:hypothetical protein